MATRADRSTGTMHNMDIVNEELCLYSALGLFLLVSVCAVLIVRVWIWAINFALDRFHRDVDTKSTVNMNQGPDITLSQNQCADICKSTSISLTTRHSEDQHVVNRCYVSLQDCVVRKTDERSLEIVGYVRVVNLAYHKRVFVRYTQDNWTSFVDISAVYMNSSGTQCSSQSHLLESDNFKFMLPVTADTTTIEFAVAYQVDGHEYWDNNDNMNYILEM